MESLDPLDEELILKEEEENMKLANSDDEDVVDDAVQQTGLPDKSNSTPDIVVLPSEVN